MWYMFTLILVSSYTANLAASLTAENLHTPIKSAEDLVNQHDVITKSNSLGIERVKESNGRYAFLMESSSIEYIMERDCDLAKVGGELDSKSYGIGMKKDSPFKKEINQAILKLQENGVLHKLKNKWWKQKGAKNCQVSFCLLFPLFFCFISH